MKFGDVLEGWAIAIEAHRASELSVMLCAVMGRLGADSAVISRADLIAAAQQRLELTVNESGDAWTLRVAAGKVPPNPQPNVDPPMHGEYNRHDT